MQAAPARPPANPAPSKRPGPAGGIVSDLSMFSLPELLEFLLNQRATGTLSLRSESLEAALELFEGQLSGARAPTGHRLVHALTEDGSVPNEQLWRALGEDPVGVTDLVVVNSVLNLQLYERKALTEKLGEHIKRSLLALVPLREGQAVFHRVPKGTTPPQPEIVIETRWALMEAVRLLDEETRDSSEADTAETPSLDPFEGI